MPRKPDPTKSSRKSFWLSQVFGEMDYQRRREHSEYDAIDAETI